MREYSCRSLRYVHVIMPRCACAKRGIWQCVCLCVCVVLQLLNDKRSAQIQASSHFFDCNLWVCKIMVHNSAQQNLSMECCYSLVVSSALLVAAKVRKELPSCCFSKSSKSITFLWTLNFWYPFQQRSRSIISHFLHHCKFNSQIELDLPS